MGVEQEFLRSYHAAILSYKKAVNFAEKHLGPEDGITENLRNVYENARSELDPNYKRTHKGGVGGRDEEGMERLMTPRGEEGHV